MAKRFFDITFSLLGIICLLPLLLMVSVCIILSSRGPVFYMATRAGYYNLPFKMFKFRTMHVGSNKSSSITSKNDPRIYKLGRYLRKFKIDELPQLINILIGDMSFIGPRPEDPKIVDLYYGKLLMESLNIKPGLASPGSLFYYTHLEEKIIDSDSEQYYVNQIMKTKVLIDVVYSRNASFCYDLKIILRTVKIIFLKAIGKNSFDYPSEYFQINNL